MATENKKEFTDRFFMMLNDDEISRLKATRLIIFGVGGVGGALANFLVRCGINNLAIVDFDRVDLTNINRQLLAFQNNIGKLKVDELEKQLKNINPALNLKTYPLKFSSETASQIDFSSYDYIIDCVDDLNAKKLLIDTAVHKKKYILSAMGAGNRYDEIPQFEIVDISKTSYDPIAKILRKYCLENRIKKLDVCYTKQKPIKNDCKTISSVVYFPVSMAAVMCAKIVNKILKEKT